ncbi:MAG: L-histidine N(alpha)-methyltransferase [Nitrosopumilus sp. B06]|nr:MAG: L-histidine N(alpha)-methyltransferase [Nitrosopumilus sp. D6]RNJ79079.1 MAG: L-histidine N(alpha)-methyltransferase [Nitrosopumilus sp. B06]
MSVVVITGISNITQGIYVYAVSQRYLSTVQENLNYKQYVVDSNLRYFKPHATAVEATFAQEISSSLGRSKKFISPKFFYDMRGSDLFEQICLLPEYYPTRTEVSILKKMGNDLAAHVKSDTRLVELGSGSSVKTRILLDVFSRVQDSTEYIPIDISEILAESSELLLRDYTALSITGIMDSYEGGLEFLKQYDSRQNLIIFLGSSFGNFSPEYGHLFLQKMRSAMKPGDLFLIGLDLVKDRDVLESAYDDSQGVTAQFNLNVLLRINAELGADFDLGNFEHCSVYDAENQRIEMHVRSLADQMVMISKSGLRLELQKGEMIHTEYSHKYSLPQIGCMLRDAGLEVVRTWTDEKEMFSLTLARRPART